MSKSCIEKVHEYLNGKMSKRDVEEAMATIERRINSTAKQGELGLGGDIEAIAKELADQAIHHSRIHKRNMLLNKKKTVTRRSNIKRKIADGMSPGEALQSELVGEVNSPVAGAKIGVDQIQRQLAERELIGAAQADMMKADVFELWRSGEMDGAIAAELYELSHGRAGSVTGNADAATIAKIMHKYQKRAVQLQNREGADIRDLAGYIVSQHHDIYRMRKAGQSQWVQDILPMLDAERTFQGADPEEFLKSAYEAMVTGIRKNKMLDETDNLVALKGFGNVAKKVSQHRMLHFKSATHWKQYSDIYSGRTLHESFNMDMQRAGRNAGLMQAFGTSPEAAFDADIRYFQREFRGEPDKLKHFEGARLRQRRNEFAELDGTTHNAEGYTLSAVGSTLRASMNMAMLGASVLSSFTDIASVASAARSLGMSQATSYAESFKNILHFYPKKERKMMASIMGVGADQFIGNVADRISISDGMPRAINKIQDIYFRVNFLTQWTDTQKRVFGAMLAHEMGMYRTKSIGQMHPKMQQALKNYGIGEREWEILRKSTVNHHIDGKDYMLPELVQEVADEDILRYAGKLDMSKTEMAKVRDSIQQKFAIFYMDQVDAAVPTPHARTRALLLQGTRPGTAVGEAMRLWAVFKSFGTTFLIKVLGRELYGKGSIDYAGLASVMTGMTAMGYVSNMARDYTKGLEQRPFDDPRTLAAAFTRGGGLGIYGDLLFQDYNFGKSAAVTFMGPGASMIDDVSTFLSQAAQGEDVAAEGLRLIKNYTPGGNLFYTKTAMDYLIWYNAQEALSPGYLRRMERRMEKETGRGFKYPPSEYVR